MAVMIASVLLPIVAFAQQSLAPHPGTLALVSVARLDANPDPAAVVSGAFDTDFTPVAGGRIHEFDVAPHWWRITVDRRVDAAEQPQLVVHSPGHSTVDVWLPGQDVPITRALLGGHADPAFSSRGLVFPLDAGLAAGVPVFLRVHSTAAMPMTVSIESLPSVHRADLVHIASRFALLGALGLLTVLAFGLWIRIGERSYAYLTLNLLAIVGFFATSGVDARILPGLGELVGGDWRIPRVFIMAAVLSGLVFLSHYLDLRARQPALQKVLIAGCGLFVAITLVTLRGTGGWMPILANIVLMLVAGGVVVAAVNGCLVRQRSAYFVVLSWLPLVSLLLVRVGEVIGVWMGPAWLEYAFSASFVLYGVVIVIGLSDTLQELRRDRDRASRLASFDGLTGAMSRPAIEARLKISVEESHLGGLPLSVVFFDVDRFKLINDQYGHGIGDSCLKIIALRTRNRLRTYDSLGRWGGDELLVVLPDTHLDEAIGVAENLRSAVNCRPLSIDGNRFEVTLSLGVAELAAGETAAQLLDRVDAALYASKEAGRDRVSGRFASSGIRLTGEHPVLRRGESVTLADE
ncbi:MAG: diguanylate cyclase [Lysobacter sp.]